MLPSATSTLPHWPAGKLILCMATCGNVTSHSFPKHHQSNHTPGARTAYIATVRLRRRGARTASAGGCIQPLAKQHAGALTLGLVLCCTAGTWGERGGFFATRSSRLAPKPPAGSCPCRLSRPAGGKYLSRTDASCTRSSSSSSTSRRPSEEPPA